MGVWLGVGWGGWHTEISLTLIVLYTIQYIRALPNQHNDNIFKFLIKDSHPSTDILDLNSVVVSTE